LDLELNKLHSILAGYFNK